MCVEHGDRLQVDSVQSLTDLPNVDIPLVVASHERPSIGSNADAADRHIFARHKLMCAAVFAEVPNLDTAALIARDQLALIWMNDNVVHRRAMVVIALNTRCSRIPNLDGAIFASRCKPLAFAVERDRRDIARMRFECGYGVVAVAVIDVVQSAPP